MAFQAANPRLFGLDLGRAASAFRQGWEGALRWPMFAWLSPQQPVRVLWPDGCTRVCLGASRSDAPRTAHPRFDALVLPSEIVLADSVTMPHLLEAEIEQALALHLQSVSPFPAGQLVWGWRVDEVTEAGLRITLAFASRPHVDRYLQSMQRGAAAGQPEVWAEVGGMVVMKGFGEQRRLASMRSQRIRILLMLAFTMLLVAALASSHFWQIRARVLEAQDQFAQLQSEVALYVDSRSALATANEKAAAIAAYLDGQVNVPQLLETLTDLLPDNAWVSRLDLDGRRIRINGQADDAAELMEKLRAQPEFFELRALSPITRGRDGKDSFHFEFVVGTPGRPE